jgi:hypothetical protein
MLEWCRKLKPSHICQECKTVHHYKNYLEVPQITKYWASPWPSNSIPSHRCKRNETHDHTKVCRGTFIVVLSIRTQSGSKCASTEEWILIDKMKYICAMAYYSAYKNNKKYWYVLMDQFWKHFSKWRKYYNGPFLHASIYIQCPDQSYL